jgi:transketolase
MRAKFSSALVRSAADPKMIFLTGDLGFMALEALQEPMGERFINAGVSEQNMMSVAAAMSHEGLNVWAYSIAPFCYARPFEQIRNDIAFHNLPVKIVGNGGGYGYGVMGPTHHAIEDYGVLLTLPNLRAYIPAFAEDVTTIVEILSKTVSPSYLRLGRDETPKDFVIPPYTPWRQLTDGLGPVFVAIGPIAATYIVAFSQIELANRPRLWVVTELPLKSAPPPPLLLDQIRESDTLCVAEEHVARGGLGWELASYLLSVGIAPSHFSHFFASAHQFDRYGSQTFLRTESGLDSASVISKILSKT